MSFFFIRSINAQVKETTIEKYSKRIIRYLLTSLIRQIEKVSFRIENTTLKTGGSLKNAFRALERIMLVS